MTTKTIKQNVSAFTVESIKPLGWSNGSTVTADVLGLDGTELESDVAVTVYAGGTTDELAVAGEDELVLVSDNPINAGSKVAIGSDLNGWQERIVDGYDSDTKTITLTSYLDENVIAGSSVVGLEMTFDLDTTQTQYDDIAEVTIVWKSDSDEDIDMRETWRFLAFENQTSGLVFKFKGAYPSIYTAVEKETLPTDADRAEQWLIGYCDLNNRDFKLVVDNELTTEIMINKMALMVGTGADISEQMYTRIEKQFEDNLKIFDGLAVWTDDNQDGIQDEEEVRTADESRPLSRGL